MTLKINENLLCCAAIIIGFENITYTVDEAAGMLEVNVRVTNPPIDIPLFTSIEVVIQTRAVNASEDSNLIYKTLARVYILLQ